MIDKEKRRERQRKYGRDNPEKISEKNKKHRMKNPEKCREANRIASRKYRKKLKIEVLNHYSNDSMKCACCGESFIEFLVLDHINGGGEAERKRYYSNTHLYAHLRRNDYPKGYRILCWNCNASLGIFGYCPHKGGAS